MKGPRNFSFIIQAPKIQSVNATYRSRVVYKYGKPVYQIFKDKSVHQYQDKINEDLKSIDFENLAPWIFETGMLFTVDIQFVLNRGIRKVDVDNLIKSFQDAAFGKRLGVNDSGIVKINASKINLKGSGIERVIVCLSEYLGPTEMALSVPPIPGRIFLGGTCAGRDWRAEIEPDLEKFGYSWFNPVVPDWTPEAKELEDREKNDLCDCHLYILTPDMIGVYSVAEVVDSAWRAKLGDSGSCFLGILGGQDEWGTAQWKSVQAVTDLVNAIGQGEHRVGAFELESPTQILDYIGRPKKVRKKKAPSEEP